MFLLNLVIILHYQCNTTIGRLSRRGVSILFFKHSYRSDYYIINLNEVKGWLSTASLPSSDVISTVSK